MVYHALFGSIVRYGGLAWGSAYNNVLHALYNVENRIITLISKKQNPSINSQIVRTKENYVIESILYCYKDLRSTYLESKKSTRNSLIPLPKYNLEVGKKNFRYTAIKYFNLMPNFLKSFNGSKYNFKMKLKKWILEHQIN